MVPKKLQPALAVQPRPQAAHVKAAVSFTAQACPARQERPPRATHVLAALGTTSQAKPAGARAVPHVLQRAQANPLGGTPAGMMLYCCSDKFMKHVAFSEQNATDKAVHIMKSLNNRDICSTLVLTDEEARQFYLQVLTWRTSGAPAGDYWMKVNFSKCVEATMGGVKTLAGTISIKVTFDGEKIVHLASLDVS